MDRIGRLELMLSMYKSAKKKTDNSKEKERYNREICNIKKELKKISKCKY